MQQHALSSFHHTVNVTQEWTTCYGHPNFKSVTQAISTGLGQEGILSPLAIASK